MARIDKQISVGRGLSPDELLSALQHEANELHEMLVGDVTRFNLRADYTSDSLQLEAVERYGKGIRYSLRYTFGWEAYWGCRDMNDGDIVSEEIDFTYRDGVAYFSREVIEGRTTKEEF